MSMLGHPFLTITFVSRLGLTPLHLHMRTTPWSVFQDGIEKSGFLGITIASYRISQSLLPSHVNIDSMSEWFNERQTRETDPKCLTNPTEDN